MTPEQLRISILKSAVHGRLTPNEIAEDSDLPAGWGCNKIGEITDVVVGATPSTSISKYWDNGNIPWLPSGSCQNCDVNSAPKYITQQGYDSCSTKLMPPNTVLIALTGATAGKVGYLRFEACGNQSVVGILPSDNMDQRYIYYYLMAERDSILADCVGSAQPHISKAYVVGMDMDIPPLEEQHRIVTKIEELLPYVDRYAEAYEKLEQFNAKFPEDMKKSILQYAIQGKLVEQRPEEGTAEDLYQQITKEKEKLVKEGNVYREKNISDIDDMDDLPDIPDTWKWCRLGELTKLITKGSSPKWQGVNYTDNEHGILFVTSENVGNEAILLDNEKYVESKFNEMHPASILKKGDILTNIVGASIGRTAVYDLDVDNANINQAVCIIRLVNLELKDYILKFLQSPYAVKHLIGDVSNGGRPNLSLTAVTNLMIALPPLEEQHRIVARIKELLPYCDRLANK